MTLRRACTPTERCVRGTTGRRVAARPADGKPQILNYPATAVNCGKKTKLARSNPLAGCNPLHSRRDSACPFIVTVHGCDDPTRVDATSGESFGNWQLAGVPNPINRRDSSRNDKLVHKTPTRIGSPAVNSCNSCRRLASSCGRESVNDLRPPLFFVSALPPSPPVLPVPSDLGELSSDRTVRRGRCTRYRHAQFCGLDGGVSATIFLREPIEKPLHLPLNATHIGIHAILLLLGIGPPSAA